MSEFVCVGAMVVVAFVVLAFGLCRAAADGRDVVEDTGEYESK